MRLTGITGTGSGKLGSSVFSVTSGTQIVRQYQPVVTNPSTAKQVNNRARLKLMSQLSAVMADVIAIPKNGMQSARNIFVQENFKATAAANGVASVDLAAIALTKGGMQIPNVLAERVEGTSVSVALADKADQLVARVVYVMFYRNSAGELQLIDSAVVETAGENGTFPYEFPYQERDVVVYAYGIFDKNAKATAKFGNYAVTSGTQVASLIADRKISDADFLLTKTRGIFVAGDISIEIREVSVGNTDINASGTTSVPYMAFGNIMIKATDVDGLYASALVDGVRVTPKIFDADGSVSLGLTNLVGGEQIRIQVGTLQGTAFVPQFTYGGTAVIAQQNTSFSAVTVNGVSISNSGRTSVATAASMDIVANGSGVVGKYLRVSVNGVARTPVAFQTVLSPARATDTLSGLLVDDVITFQIGRMVNGTFVEDVAFGGSAVIAEVPPVFSSVSVNGQNVPSTGTTSVVRTGSDTMSVTTQNAINKYLAVLDGNNQVKSVHAISANTINVQLSVAVGDIVKLAIGTGSSTSSFVAQTNYGGSIEFVDAPAVHITTLRVNGSQVTRSTTVTPGSHAVVAATDITGETSDVFTFIKASTKPAVGVAVSNITERLAISNGQVDGRATFENHVVHWAALGAWDETAGTFTPVSVFDYSLEGYEEE